MSRFQKGQSGNPNGRPRKRRPDVSAFDILFDKRLTVTQGGKERELTVDEALQVQTYQAALKGSRMAIRKVLKMIEKREVALAKKAPLRPNPVKVEIHHTSDNANAALCLLGIARPDDDDDSRRWKVEAWATQAALSRPGRRQFSPKDVHDIKFFTWGAETLRWPRGSEA